MKKILKLVIFSEKKAEKNCSASLVQQNKKKKHGFSLIEMIISIFIFSILILMLTGTFAGFYKNYAKQKKVQKDVENAQYVLNLMNKTLRTSLIVSSPSNGNLDLNHALDAYDYSQGQCIRYFLEGGMLKYSLSLPQSPADPSTCIFSNSNSSNLSSININSAHVYYTGVTNYGKITIVLYVQQDTTIPGQETSEIPIQSSVSLRQ